jgi:histidinol-phosphate aminotransferase
MITPRPEVAALHAYRPGRPVSLDPTLPLVNLAANENNFGPSPAVARALSAFTGWHRYPTMGGADLASEIARDVGLRADQVLFGTGSGNLLKCIAEAFVRPHDRVVVIHPTFSLYAQYARMMGADVIAVPGDGRQVDWNRWVDVVRDVKPRVAFLCSPNNPTGDLADAGVVRETLAALPDDALLVADEAYVHFAQAAPDLLAYVRQGAPVAVVRTFSKAYGLAALRLGWMAAPEPVVSAVGRVREPFPVSSVTLEAARAAWNDKDHLAWVIRAVQDGRARLAAALSGRGWWVNPQAQGNFVWAKPPEDLDATRLVLQLREAGILIRDGSGFGAPGFVRISVGRPDEITRLLQALDGDLAPKEGPTAV